MVLALLAVATPWLPVYGEAMLNVSYGVLVLILLASLSIAVACHENFALGPISILSEDEFFRIAM